MIIVVIITIIIIMIMITRRISLFLNIYILSMRELLYLIENCFKVLVDFICNGTSVSHYIVNLLVQSSLTLGSCKLL